MDICCRAGFTSALIMFLWPCRGGVGKIAKGYSENTETQSESLEENNNGDLPESYSHPLYN
jgi:hypothetical protein